jgi:hypothetical protein
VPRALAVILVLLGGCGRSTDEPDRSARPAPARDAAIAVADARTPPGVHAIQIVMAWNTALVRMSDGSLRGWGRYAGLLARSTDADVTTPQHIAGVTGAVDLVIDDVGDATACARDAAATWTCWGDGDGLPGGRAGAHPPAPMPAFAGATVVRLGGDFGCLVRADRTLACWGKQPLHADPARDRARPLATVAGLDDVVDVELDGRVICALRAAGTVACWGVDDHGDAYATAPEIIAAPRPIAGVTGAVEVAIGYGFGCARVRGGDLACWGFQRDAISAIRSEPGARFLRQTGIEICELTAAGRERCLAMPDRTSCAAWAAADPQTLGYAHRYLGVRPCETAPRWTNVTMPAARDVATDTLAATRCAITLDGDVTCAGKNDHGQLGDGTLIDRAAAAPVIALVEPGATPAAPAMPVDPDARETPFDQRPPACPIDATIAIAHPAWPSGDLAVRSAWAKVDSGLELALRDYATSRAHAFDVEVRGDLRALRLATLILGSHGDLREAATGVYPVLPEPPKVGRWADGELDASHDKIDLAAGIPALVGTVTLTHIDARWVCGRIDVHGPHAHVRGAFAAERAD